MSRRRRRRRISVLSVMSLIMFFAIIILAVVLVFRAVTGGNNPLKAAEIQTVEYTDDSGNTATRGYINVSYSSFSEIDSRHFKSYVNSVSGKYSRFTIILSGGDGIVLTDGTKDNIQYGYINSEGAITECFGNIVLSDGIYKYRAN